MILASLAGLVGNWAALLACLAVTLLMFAWPFLPRPQLVKIRPRIATLSRVVAIAAFVVGMARSVQEVGRDLDPPPESVVLSANQNSRPYVFRDAYTGGEPTPRIPASAAIFLQNLGEEELTVFVGLVAKGLSDRPVYVQERKDIPPGVERLMTFMAWSPGSCYLAVILVPTSAEGLRVLIEMQQRRYARDIGELTADGTVDFEYVNHEDICVVALN